MLQQAQINLLPSPLAPLTSLVRYDRCGNVDLRGTAVDWPRPLILARGEAMSKLDSTKKSRPSLARSAEEIWPSDSYFLVVGEGSTGSGHGNIRDGYLALFGLVVQRRVSSEACPFSETNRLWVRNPRRPYRQKIG